MPDTDITPVFLLSERSTFGARESCTAFARRALCFQDSDDEEEDDVVTIKSFEIQVLDKKYWLTYSVLGDGGMRVYVRSATHELGLEFSFYESNDDLFSVETRGRLARSRDIQAIIAWFKRATEEYTVDLHW